MTNSTKPTVGCAGAGVLGAAIARRLVDRGFDVRVWNRSRDKIEPLLAAGAREARTPAELARDAELVITCVTDGAAVEAVVFGDDGVASAAREGSLLVDMSTIDPALTRALGQRLRAQCAMGWLDAPISGGAPAAAAGRMAILVGGERADFERARPLWDALAGRCTLMGTSGAGQTTKMVNQVLVACGFSVLAEACALAERAGVDPARIPDALAGGRADSKLLQEFMPRMATSNFDVTGSIAIMLKDLEMIGELARGAGAPMPITALVRELFRKMVSDGRGDHDTAELVELYRERG